MNRFSLLLFGGLLLTFGSLHAQEFSYGFKAGLNFSSFSGPLEKDATGMEVEELEFESGFQVAALFNIHLNEYFGIRPEFMYSQKGGRYRYNGPAYQFLMADSGKEIVTTGDKKITLNITNSYIDIPVLAFVRPLEWLEFSAGVNVGFLVGSTAAGELIYSGKSLAGGNVNEYSYTLEYNYYKDEETTADFATTTVLTVDGEKVTLPFKAGAYYNLPKVDGSFFNVLDFGLNAGMSLYLNRSLFVGARFTYGLADVTNNDYDYSQLELDGNNQRIPRADTDRNLSIQTSDGFSF